MKPKFPKVKKVKKSTLKKKVDQVFSLFIRRHGVCQGSGHGCECGGNLQCAHIISRWNLRLRWDEMNVLCLCAGHHRYWTNRPLEWADFIRKNFSKQYNYVMTHKEEKKKMKESDYREVIERYTE